MNPAFFDLSSRVAESGLGRDLADAVRRTSMLDPAAAQASEVSRLWWIFFYVCTAVFAAVIAATTVAIWRARRVQASAPPPPDAGSTVQRDRPLVFGVSTAVALTVAILFTLLIRDFFADRALQPLNAPDALTIKVTGHQWWWQVEYQDPVAQNVIETANEIHLPAGRPIQLQLQATDVIHSFWVPNLSGKKDLVPGHPSSLWLKVDKPGIYYGQCAEFCGYQHANMKLLVVVDTPEAFATWQNNARALAPEPTTDRQRRGRDLFLSGTCVMCHTVSGTIARSRVGPILNGLASRRTLAAGALPNDHDHLSRWIQDPQASKPGVRMPQNNLSPEDLEALVDYLQTLH